MVFRSSPEQKCFTHREAVVGLCSWCSTPICNKCIMAADGKKYCPKCVDRKGKAESPAASDKKSYGEAPRQAIRNVDPNFTPGHK